MNEFKSIGLVNLKVLIICALVARYLASSSPNTDLQGGILMISMGFVLGHVLLNIVLALIFAIMRRPAMARAFLGNSGLVLLVGFSVCWGNSAI